MRRCAVGNTRSGAKTLTIIQSRPAIDSLRIAALVAGHIDGALMPRAPYEDCRSPIRFPVPMNRLRLRRSLPTWQDLPIEYARFGASSLPTASLKARREIFSQISGIGVWLARNFMTSSITSTRARPLPCSNVWNAVKDRRGRRTESLTNPANSADRCFPCPMKRR